MRSGAATASAAADDGGKGEVTLLDYGAGNVRSVRNAIIKLGFTVRTVTKPEEVASASRLIFPGVGAFGSAMDILRSRGLIDPLREYVASGKPFMGVCLGLQLLFDGSEESGGIEGLGVIPVYPVALYPEPYPRALINPKP
jgi:glutamine amidotransferase/cyclase